MAIETPSRPSATAEVQTRTGSRQGLALALLCSVQFMLVLDLTIVNVALPSIQRDLGVSREDLQWVISGYALSFGGFLMLAGRAADLYGRRRFFMLGLAVFALASLAGGLSHSSSMLIAARIVQGFGGAMVSPAALSLLTTTFPEGPARNRALAVWGAVASAGGAVGLLLSGVITDGLGWSWVFFVNVPVGLLAVGLAPLLLDESRAVGPRPRLDLAGALTVTLGSLLLVFGLSHVDSVGLLSPQTLLTVGSAVVILALFVAIERRVAAPLLPLGILRRRSLTGANVVTLLLTAVIGAQGFFATFYLQQVLGFSALATGLAFLPFAIAIMVVSTLGPRLVARFGTRLLLVVGMSSIALGMLALVRLPVNGSYLVDLLPAFLLIAVGMGLSFFSATVAATSGVPDYQQGVASGLINTSAQVGGALGLAVLLSIGSAVASAMLAAGGADAVSAFVAGFHTAHGVGALLAATGAGVAVLAMR